MNDSIVELLQQAGQLKTDLDNLRPLDKEREAIVLQKLRLDWNYHSNHLEGNSLTFGETKALILFGITAQGKPLQDHIEITGHDEAIKWIEDVVKKREPLTESFIRQLHTLLLKKPYEVDAITPDGQPTKKLIKVGEYKTTPNHVKTKTGEIFRFASPEETPAKMYDLLEWFKEKEADKETNPILFAADFHYKFIRIHPFDDGNGRMARMLMNFILLQYGYPPVIVRTGEKAQYIAALEQADAGIFDPFIEFIVTNQLRSLEIMLKGAHGESIEEPDDLDKELALLKQKFKAKRKRIEKEKNNKTILEFKTDIYPTIVEVLKGYTQKFAHFYSEVFVESSMDNILVSAFNIESFELNAGIEELKFRFKFNRVAYDGLENINFQETLSIKFNKTKYILIIGYHIFDEGKSIIEKLYSEAFEKEDKALLLKELSKYHKDFLNKLLENR